MRFGAPRCKSSYPSTGGGGYWCDTGVAEVPETAGRQRLRNPPSLCQTNIVALEPDEKLLFRVRVH